MPSLGLGVYDMYGREAEDAVNCALEIGYRLIDTASMYRNEVEIGNAIRRSGVRRAEIFITTKVHNRDQGYESTLRAFDESEKKINCGPIDLYLVHWPLKPTRKDTWRALEKLYSDGRVRAIGVSNYLQPFLDELAKYATVQPAVNQVEFSPYLYRRDLLLTCSNRKIHLQAFSPLGRGQRMKDPRLLSLAEKYGKTPAQIMLRWILQRGASAIPKSVNPARLKENFEVFDFELQQEDLSYIDTFNEDLRVAEDPMDMW